MPKVSENTVVGQAIKAQRDDSKPAQVAATPTPDAVRAAKSDTAARAYADEEEKKRRAIQAGVQTGTILAGSENLGG